MPGRTWRGARWLGVGAWLCAQPIACGDDGVASTGGGAGVGGAGGEGGGAVVAPDPARFLATGSLSTARTNHTATLLLDGRVAVIGGERYDYRMLRSIEVYDRSTEQFTEVGALGEARSNHTATRLASGAVLVVGGGSTNNVGGPAGQDVLGSVELFDPSSGAVASAAPLVAARSHHTATLLPDGRVLVVGGSSDSHQASASFGDALASVELYDPATAAWRAAPPLATPRFLHTATLLENGRVLIAGGSNATEDELVTTELFDASTEAWSAGPALNEARVFHAAAALPDGGAFVVAGKLANKRFLATSERLSAGAEAWGFGPELPQSRTGMALSALSSGRLIATAGLHGSTAGFSHLGDAMIFDPAASTWAPIEGLGTPRVLHTSTTLLTGEVLIVGGLSSSAALDSAELAVP